MSEHVIEYWETCGDRRSQWTATCLTCGFIGGDGTRAEAEAEAEMHERGERQPWNPESVEPWTSGRHPIPDFKMR